MSECKRCYPTRETGCDGLPPEGTPARLPDSIDLQPESEGGATFELRVQGTPTRPGAATAGRALGRFSAYEQALAALDAEQDRLTEQLVANGEGWSGVRLDMAIIEVSAGTEAGWLWSSYRPGSDPTRR